MLWPSRTYRFTAPVVHGKERPRHGQGNTWTPQETKDAQEAIAMAYVAATQKAGTRRKAPAGVPVEVRVRIRRGLSYEAARKGAVAEWDMRRPDVDNVLKTVMDALEGVAYEDDKQVVGASVTRCLADRGQRQEEVEVAVTVPRMWDDGWNLIRDPEEV